jgi:hypothetical protein
MRCQCNFIILYLYAVVLFPMSMAVICTVFRLEYCECASGATMECYGQLRTGKQSRACVRVCVCVCVCVKFGVDYVT